MCANKHANDDVGVARHSLDSDSLELQPLTSNKGVLRRMPRVRSDEMSQDDSPDEPTASESLVHRLLQMKSREREREREREDHSERSPQREVIGAGLPLLQRLLLLKAKEDRETAAVQGAAASAADALAAAAAAGGPASPRRRTRGSLAATSPEASPTPDAHPDDTVRRSSILKRIVSMKRRSEAPHHAPSVGSDDAADERTSSDEGALSKKGAERDRGESATSPPKSATSAAPTGRPTWGLLRKATISSRNKTRSRGADEPGRPKPPLPPPGPMSTLKPLGLSGPCLSNVGEEEEDEENEAPVAATSMSTPNLDRKPPLLRLRQNTKLYRSIDDLSPEYCGLPFVKKLKILNERQKLAQLEATAGTRSSSLDSGGVEQDEDLCSLTRSHSETCAMAFQRGRARIPSVTSTATRPTNLSGLPSATAAAVTAAAVTSPTVLSPESNETVERRHLKSILKKLSSGSLLESTNVPAAASDTSTTTAPAAATDMRRLMRAPTLEGYAARHSKLSKSVTFNRETLQSPPSAAATPATPAATPAATPTSRVPAVGVEAATSPTQTQAPSSPLRAPSISSSAPLSPPPAVTSPTAPEPPLPSAPCTPPPEPKSPTPPPTPPKARPEYTSPEEEHPAKTTAAAAASRRNQDEDFGAVILGIKQVIHGHLVSVPKSAQNFVELSENKF